MSAAILDLPVLGDDAARIIAELVVAENIAAVAGEAALRPPPLLEVLPAVARLVRRVLPAVMR
jgi:S-adenosylmethionine synthetase